MGVICSANIGNAAAAAAAESLQSCPTLCDPTDGSPPGSPGPGILQARTLEWVAISFSNAWKWKVKVKSLSLVRLFVTPWTAAHQAPPSMGFSRQEYWSGVPLPSPMHEREKWKWSRSVVSNSLRPHGLQPTRLLQSMGFSRQEYWIFTANRRQAKLYFNIYLNYIYIVDAYFHWHRVS